MKAQEEVTSCKTIDRKRKHLEKDLNASQRDVLLSNEAREDISLSREIIDSIESTNEIFNNTMTSLSNNIKTLSDTWPSQLRCYPRVFSSHNSKFMLLGSQHNRITYHNNQFKTTFPSTFKILTNVFVLKL